MIRPYSPCDLEQLLDIWYRASLIAHAFLPDEFLEEERQLIVERFLPESETIVYEADGLVVGFLSLVGNEVGGIFVDPDRQRRGIGGALIDHARQMRPHLELSVFEANTIGRSFYDSCGFELIGRRIEPDTGQPELRLRIG